MPPYTERNWGLLFLRTERAFDGLRTHPRYVRVEQQMRASHRAELRADEPMSLL